MITDSLASRIWMSNKSMYICISLGSCSASNCWWSTKRNKQQPFVRKPLLWTSKEQAPESNIMKEIRIFQRKKSGFIMEAGEPVLQGFFILQIKQQITQVHTLQINFMLQYAELHQPSRFIISTQYALETLFSRIEQNSQYRFQLVCQSKKHNWKGTWLIYWFCVHSFVLELDMHKDNVHLKSYNKWAAQIATYRRRLCPGILTHSCSGCSRGIKLLSKHVNTTIKWLTSDHSASHSVVHWHAFSGAGSLSSSSTFTDAQVAVALSCTCWLVSSSLCPKQSMEKTVLLGLRVAPHYYLGSSLMNTSRHPGWREGGGPVQTSSSRSRHYFQR